MVTICGVMEGWDIVRCRTVPLPLAMMAWGKWAVLVLNATQDDPLTMGPFTVWRAA